jgi:hypothetical protein
MDGRLESAGTEATRDRRRPAGEAAPPGIEAWCRAFLVGEESSPPFRPWRGAGGAARAERGAEGVAARASAAREARMSRAGVEEEEEERSCTVDA